jgi:hypothetical protein
MCALAVRTVFSIVAAMTVWLFFTICILYPVLDSQLCEELMSEHNTACHAISNATACGNELNPLLGGRDKPRCTWVANSEMCDINTQVCPHPVCSPHQGLPSSCAVCSLIIRWWAMWSRAKSLHSYLSSSLA